MKIGIQEMLIVFIVALIVVGPDKLPYYAKKLGEAFGQFKKYTDQATKDIRESVVEPLEEAQKPLREAMEPVTELEKSVRGNVKDIQKSINNIGKPAKPEPKEAADAEPSAETVSSEADTPAPETPVQPAGDTEVSQTSDQDNASPISEQSDGTVDTLTAQEPTDTAAAV
jgi:sec-independent protein translocase protein TatB